MSEFNESNLGSSSRNDRRIVDGPNTLWDLENREDWFYDVLIKLRRIGQLEENWDSYGAPAIKSSIVVSTLQILNSLMRKNIPIPEMVPTSNGGIQLEWHTNSVNFEITVISPVQANVVWDDDNNPQDFTDRLMSTYDLSPLVIFAEKLERCISDEL